MNTNLLKFLYVSPSDAHQPENTVSKRIASYLALSKVDADQEINELVGAGLITWINDLTWPDVTQQGIEYLVAGNHLTARDIAGRITALVSNLPTQALIVAASDELFAVLTSHLGLPRELVVNAFPIVAQRGDLERIIREGETIGLKVRGVILAELAVSDPVAADDESEDQAVARTKGRAVHNPLSPDQFKVLVYLYRMPDHATSNEALRQISELNDAQLRQEVYPPLYSKGFISKKAGMVVINRAGSDFVEQPERAHELAEATQSLLRAGHLAATARPAPPVPAAAPASLPPADAAVGRPIARPSEPSSGTGQVDVRRASLQAAGSSRWNPKAQAQVAADEALIANFLKEHNGHFKVPEGSSAARELSAATGLVGSTLNNRLHKLETTVCINILRNNGRYISDIILLRDPATGEAFQPAVNNVASESPAEESGLKVGVVGTDLPGRSEVSNDDAESDPAMEAAARASAVSAAIGFDATRLYEAMAQLISDTAELSRDSRAWRAKYDQMVIERDHERAGHLLAEQDCLRLRQEVAVLQDQLDARTTPPTNITAHLRTVGNE